MEGSNECGHTAAGPYDGGARGDRRMSGGTEGEAHRQRTNRVAGEGCRAVRTFNAAEGGSGQP
ncbi:hypothetical protein GCM10010317_003980 [Streptomyces mirabilis]|nr:hypothetical protein GCM10010317_003980 [Streptomyces mirabilis]